MENIWELKIIEQKKVKEIQKRGYGKILSVILSQRFEEIEKIESFLEPTRYDFKDPFEIIDIKKAVDNIIETIERGEKITIYGDYDADGVTSTYTLSTFLREVGANVDTYIPNRFDEGYGLNKNAIDKIHERGTNLIITVDTGITAVEEVEYIKEKGMKVIITDHHEPKDVLPNALAVVDLKRKENTTYFSEFAGCGIAFKLIQAISKKKGLNDNEYLKYLDIVAVGTISDVVPIKEENRTITKLGLKLLRQTRNFGLKEMMNFIEMKEDDSEYVSFKITPKINAAGRMETANHALELFLAKNKLEAMRLANRLDNYNELRQKIEKEIVAEVIKEIDNSEDDIIVLAKKGWHHGVIGIVASRIVALYNKPVILLTIENGVAKGSGRSVDGLDLYSILSNFREYFISFGGHSKALGLSLDINKLEEFRENLKKYVKENVKLPGVKKFIIEYEINEKLEIEAVRELNKLRPYGEENRNPIFMFKDLIIENIQLLRENKHLKLTIRTKFEEYIDVIGFSLGYLAKDLKVKDKIDIIGNLEINEFNGNEKVQIKLIDLRKGV